MKPVISLLLVCLSAALVRGQEQTIVDAAGDTIVVEVITEAAGVVTTETLETLTGTSTSSSTTTAVDQGPVAEPAATTVAGETTYQYTTTDAEGNTEVITATFTPSTALDTSTTISSFTGTVYGYTDYQSIIGTNTVAADTDASAGALRTSLPSRKVLAAVGAALLSGAVGGVWLVL